jgi:small subunit ribosomal protein S6
MPEENQRQYELTFILSPELDEKGVDSFEQEIEKSIKNLGGDLKKKSKPERRNLSYPIKKFQTGYYSVINFLFNPEKLEELSTIFKHKKEILRYILTIAEEPAVIKKPFGRQERSMESRLAKTETKDKERIEKFKKLTEEVTEKEIEALKKTGKKEPLPIEKPKEDKKEKKKVKLEEIDKKLDEILGI